MKVAFVGKTSITEYEANVIRTLAQILALMGHHVVTTAADGTNEQVRKGVVEGGGRPEVRNSGALAGCDQAIVYADDALIETMKASKVIPDPRVAVIETQDQLDSFCDYAVVQGYERNII